MTDARSRTLLLPSSSSWGRGDGDDVDAGSGEWLAAARKLLAENGMGEDQGADETTAVDDVKEGEAF